MNKVTKKNQVNTRELPRIGRPQFIRYKTEKNRKLHWIICYIDENIKGKNLKLDHLLRKIR